MSYTRCVSNLWFEQSRDEQATPSSKGGLSAVTPRYSSAATVTLSSKTWQPTATLQQILLLLQDNDNDDDGVT